MEAPFTERLKIPYTDNKTVKPKIRYVQIKDSMRKELYVNDKLVLEGMTILNPVDILRLLNVMEVIDFEEKR